MKRRKAIGRILAAGGAVVLGFGSYEWYELAKKPDIPYLLAKKELLADLAETIIPVTQIPGAKEAGAVDFMVPILAECTEPKTLNRFIDGLRDLESHTRSRYQRDFTQCTANEKEEILHYFEEESRPVNRLVAKAKNKYLGRPFFETLKWYTVECYCISEKGATQGLTYIAVPGSYQACIPLAPMQKAWATK